MVSVTQNTLFCSPWLRTISIYIHFLLFLPFYTSFCKYLPFLFLRTSVLAWLLPFHLCKNWQIYMYKYICLYVYVYNIYEWIHPTTTKKSIGKQSHQTDFGQQQKTSYKSIAPDHWLAETQQHQQLLLHDFFRKNGESYQRIHMPIYLWVYIRNNNEAMRNTYSTWLVCWWWLCTKQTKKLRWFMEMPYPLSDDNTQKCHVMFRFTVKWLWITVIFHFISISIQCELRDKIPISFRIPSPNRITYVIC